ncbi:UNVERIFIED_CONTAM: hypothetical protein FKN15_007001 [Acipenser sinensis]
MAQETQIQWPSSDPTTQEHESRCQRATDLWRTKASPAAVCSELTGRLASRVRCRAMRRHSPCQFYLPSTRDHLSQRDTPFRVHREDWPTSQPGREHTLYDSPCAPRASTSTRDHLSQRDAPFSVPCKDWPTSQPGREHSLYDSPCTPRASTRLLQYPFLILLLIRRLCIQLSHSVCAPAKQKLHINTRG